MGQQKRSEPGRVTNQQTLAIQPAAFVIFPDGHTEEIKPFNLDGTLSLDQMQRAVGGYVEPVPCELTGYAMFVNEDGIEKRLPANAHSPDGLLYFGNILVVRRDLMQ